MEEQACDNKHYPALLGEKRHSWGDCPGRHGSQFRRRGCGSITRVLTSQASKCQKFRAGVCFTMRLLGKGDKKTRRETRDDAKRRTDNSHNAETRLTILQ